MNPTISVGVKVINSRKLSITGYIEKPGQYDILAPMDVVQLISLAGGLREYTNGKEIRILRTDGGKQTSFRFNYKEVLEGKNLNQNIQLKPGDRVGALWWCSVCRMGARTRSQTSCGAGSPTSCTRSNAIRVRPSNIARAAHTDDQKPLASPGEPADAETSLERGPTTGPGAYAAR